MDDGKKIEQDMLSILKMDHIIFDKLSFFRKGFKNEDSEVELRIKTGLHKIQDGKYQVMLNVLANKDDEYDAEVQVTGYCRIDENCGIKDELLKKNAIAILFPYVRAQFTLLTSQPETEPIVFPAVNINAILENKKV